MALAMAMVWEAQEESPQLEDQKTLVGRLATRELEGPAVAEPARRPEARVASEGKVERGRHLNACS
jgi:hypothetical protein